jgi:hypothetical protein
MGLMDTFFGEDTVAGFQGVQQGTQVDPSLGAVVGGLGGSVYKNIIKPPIQAMDYLGREINRSVVPRNEWEQAKQFNPQQVTQAMAEVGMLPTVGGLMAKPSFNTLSSMGAGDARGRIAELTKIIDNSGIGLLARRKLPEFAERKDLIQYMKDISRPKAPRVEKPTAEEPKGLMRGVDEYAGTHQAPSMDYGTTIDDLAQMYPEDIYSPQGLQYYGNQRNATDVESYKKLMAVKGKPNKIVTVYRAVPKGVEGINKGDWITLSKKYAKDHGEAALNGEYDILKTTAKAKDIVTDANDLNELGYWGEPVTGRDK